MEKTPDWLLVDSITQAVGNGRGRAVVSGSHGGRSAAQAGARLAVFNDAGVGRDDAGIAALSLLQDQGVAACTVSHRSARIGEARSTLDDGVISFANLLASQRGARPGVRLRDWLLSLPT